MTFVEDRSVLSRAARAPDQVITCGQDPDHIAEVWVGGAGADKQPLLLIIHGGFWRPQYDRAHTRPMAEALAAAGWTAASAEYRRIPGNPDATFEDVGRALQIVPGRVRHHNGRVVLIGHSAGGHLVLWLSAARRTPELSGTLALAPAADLRLAHQRNLGDGAAQAFLGITPASRTDADPCRLPSPDGPITIVHGAQDEIVPVALAESYVLTHPRTRLVRVADAGHFAIIDPASGAWPVVLAELRALSAEKTVR
ncbi:MAG TPA: alpha/beta hydrolase [Steroidobacteraceae bacterium]|nr:alpha/beta hydrolase [Steroidobacteraceae bacterium]